jgi:hypothetical protein
MKEQDGTNIKQTTEIWTCGNTISRRLHYIICYDSYARSEFDEILEV